MSESLPPVFADDAIAQPQAESAPACPAAVAAGRIFARAVMDIDARKSAMTSGLMEGSLTALVRSFAVAASLDLDVTISFCDVHALMNRQFHTELAFVRLDGKQCSLLFHTKLISFTDPNAGFIFIANSWVLLMVIAEMNRANGPARKDFVFEIGDNASLDQVSYNSTHAAACLILDHHFAVSNGYAEFRDLCNARMVPWQARATKLFWRGSTTGMRTAQPPPEGQPDDLLWLPRLRLCQAAKHDDIRRHCDIGIASIVQIAETYVVERIRNAGIMKDPTPREQFMRYKAVIDIDGNANAWSGLFCSLLGASCVLKVASQQGFHQWYYKDLKPWLHYVPVQADLSDMHDAINWFIDHGSHAFEIAQRGREFAAGVTLENAVRASAINLARFCQNR